MGPAVQLMQAWADSPQNTLIVTEPDYPVDDVHLS
jgi:hypothetical protein